MRIWASHHSTRCMSRLARRWCPSRATRCRCNTRRRDEGASALPRRAGLFDVSHMGQVILRAPGPITRRSPPRWRRWCRSICGPGAMRQRYGMFTNDAGGILDDLMMANRGDHMFVVVNAACKDADIAHMRAISTVSRSRTSIDRALLALQGPSAEAVLPSLVPAVRRHALHGCGTPSAFGEAGSRARAIPARTGSRFPCRGASAEPLARRFWIMAMWRPSALARATACGWRRAVPLRARYRHHHQPGRGQACMGDPEGAPRGRRARGGLSRRRAHPRELRNGGARARVGLRPEGRAPMREGTALYADAEGGDPVGRVTSGAFGPTSGRRCRWATCRATSPRRTPFHGELRGKRQPVRVARCPSPGQLQTLTRIAGSTG